MKKATLKALICLVLVLAVVGGHGARAAAPTTYTVSGTVTRADNKQGLEGVVLSFSGGFGSVSTGPDGRWRMEGLQGKVTIVPVKKGWKFRPESEQVSRADKSVDFKASFDTVPIAFPDPALRTAIQQATGKPNQIIYFADLVRLVEFEAAGRGIKDLTGLDYAGELVKLDLSRNKVQALDPLADLIHLRELRLEGNQFADLRPLAGLARLERLYLRGNQITDLQDLAGLTNLRELDLRDNPGLEIAPGLPARARVDGFLKLGCRVALDFRDPSLAAALQKAAGHPQDVPADSPASRVLDQLRARGCQVYL